MDNSVKIGIVGVLTMLLGVGGTILLTPTEVSNSYVCSTTNSVVVAERLSSTNVTAYWTVNGTIKSSVCTKGKWLPLSGYIEQTPVTPIVPVAKTETIYADGRRVFS